MSLCTVSKQAMNCCKIRYLLETYVNIRSQVDLVGNWFPIPPSFWHFAKTKGFSSQSWWLAALFKIVERLATKTGVMDEWYFALTEFMLSF